MQTVGVIGLGLMGKPMASNLLKAAFAVTVFNRSRPAMDALAAEGATLAASPAEVGRASDVVVTMVPDSPDVEAVLLGPDGVCSAAKPAFSRFEAMGLPIRPSPITPTVCMRRITPAKAR